MPPITVGITYAIPCLLSPPFFADVSFFFRP